jgi:uncharacterized protein
MRYCLIFFCSFFFIIACKIDGYNDYPIHAVPFTDVMINDSFWSPRIEINRTVTIPHDFAKCEETGRINNFAIAGKKKTGKFKGLCFDDSDVYKIIEGASYSLATHPDPELSKYLDSLITLIAAAQEPDGYLYTYRTVNVLNNEKDVAERWKLERIGSHETYNQGHMFEAAVAHYMATGKRTLLDVAIKSADMFCNTFGPGKAQSLVSGHQEIEIGLVKLYRVTGEKKYLDLAKLMLENRGKSNYAYDPTHFWDSPANHQDDKPIHQQTEAYGHAVRATYMYTAIADVAALTNDTSYENIIDKIWNNVVSTKIYITGSIGASPRGEEYGTDYSLANDTAYNETCAAISNVFWNHRMFLLHGESKYYDVLERTLYNGLISGYSLDGKEFFYPNVLESDGAKKYNMGACGRQQWFGCSCCPTNISRFISSLAGYIYATNKDTVFVNLFIGSKGKTTLGGKNLTISQVTEYPWKGKIQIIMDPENQMNAVVAVRIPCWTTNNPLPGDLYSFTNKIDASFKLVVNSKKIPCEMHNGYVLISRRWNKGDKIELELQMPIRKIIANEKVKADSGRICLSRGPLVYCAEGVDNNGKVLNLMLKSADSFNFDLRKDLSNGIWGISGKAYIDKRIVPFKAIPYFAWGNRGCNEMEVWFKKK